MTPSVKYSPLSLVLRSYLRPFWAFTHSTVAPAMGLPSVSLQTPLTLPVTSATAEGMQYIRIRLIRIGATKLKRCFIFPSTRSIFRNSIPRQIAPAKTVPRDQYLLTALQPLPCKESDPLLQPREMRAIAACNYRTLRTPDLPGCNKTTLNPTERLIQGHALQSQIF